jgi:GTPase SAR1 family protein
MKIGLTGSVSVGKTTLIEALSKLPQFENYHIATERSKYLRDLGIPLNTDSTFKGQIIFTAERSSELMRENLLTDRTVIDVMAFTSLSDSMIQSEKNVLNSLSSKLVKEYDYVFYIPTDGVDIEDNGVRTIDPIYRANIDLKIKHIIYTHNIPYVVLKGTTQERIDTVLKTLNF